MTFFHLIQYSHIIFHLQIGAISVFIYVLNIYFSQLVLRNTIKIDITFLFKKWIAISRVIIKPVLELYYITFLVYTIQWYIFSLPNRIGWQRASEYLSWILWWKLIADLFSAGAFFYVFVLFRICLKIEQKCNEEL